MNSTVKKWILFILALAVIGGTVSAITSLNSLRRLGPPGIRATPIPGKLNMKFDLPPSAAGFSSTNMPEAEVVTNLLPKDTSYAERHYFAPDGTWAVANIILMGSDRTSIHRPSYCLPGQGWQIIKRTEVKLHIPGPHPYELPIQKWTIQNTFTAPDGTKQQVTGFYVFWFVTRGESTDSYSEMLKSTLFHQLRHGMLQRWAYISWFTISKPGQEDATFAKLKKLITAAVPKFQLPLGTAK